MGHNNPACTFCKAVRKVIFVETKKIYTMGILTPKGKKGDKKGNNSNADKNNQPQSKFMNKGVKSVAKKQMPGSAQRGS